MPLPYCGYKVADVTPEVWQLLLQFDQAYTRMHNQLQAAWSGGSQQELDDAVDTMVNDLRGPAVALMQIPVPAEPAPTDSAFGSHRTVVWGYDNN